MKRFIGSGRKLITILSVLSILAVSIFSAFSGVDFKAVAETPSNAVIWDGCDSDPKATQFDSGDGSALDPYIITNGDQLYRMIFGDNLMFFHVRLSRNYWLISTYQIAQGKNDETLDSLEKMCYHAIEYDKAYINDHGKYFTSILTDKLIYPEPSKDFHELTEHTNCYHMLEKLQHNRYDCIRQDLRFVSIIEKLNQYSK